ncbi:TROVE domain-containing protein [Saccharothrix variisporea]|uniref:TROVE domain-containing protein n=1 Tax=Saccharothrix variisporea TaxID=543527 RepID=A0A495XK87_9PSEU|nr:TROVE domain-containing protein [Saccharothrix variisporea]RKT74099.1 TROVE domain-containing protein [Saccharothrix variisporea]
MAKFNRGTLRALVRSFVESGRTPSGTTHEGGPGYARDTRSELFLLAVTTMVGEPTAYEAAGERDDRYAALVRAAALEDPDWTARLLAWLRTGANLRTAALVGAAEYVRARLGAGDDRGPSNRSVVDSVLRRADEPGELLAHWLATHGRAVPKPVKRGVADAVLRLYDERALIKYDSPARALRFGDVLNLVHPTGGRADLFTHALDRRYGHDTAVPASLTVLARRAELLSWPVERRRALFDRGDAVAVLREAGMTWESVAGWLQGPLTAAVWEALIPSMGYMALLRNLRNFDRAGVSDEVAARVAARLADPDQVARSRQLPLRFLSAHRAVGSSRWAGTLAQALDHSLRTVPELPGRTLVLVDTSGSMNAPFSRDGTLHRWDAAAVFGLALGIRCADADVVSFSSPHGGRPETMPFPLRRDEPLLSAVTRWKEGGYFIGGGTYTARAIQRHLRGHDRVVVLTDEQAADDVDRAVPPGTPLYTWNLAGDRRGHTPSGARDRHTFGGLTDQAFGAIRLLEAGRNADWPF